MAVLAGLLNFDMVISCAHPGTLRVAILAEVIAGEVLGMFARGTNAIMADTTIRGRAFELSGYMAVGAVDEFVSADQREAR